MTALLPDRAGPSAEELRRDLRHRRPLVLLAPLAGAVAAAGPLLVCLALGVAGWFLTDAGGHGTPRDGLWVGALAWLVAHGSGVHVEGALVSAMPLGLTLVCANPDIVVERGDRLIYCAGAIAELYRELGGEVIFYGKPHRPIYERAMAIAQERRGTATPLSRVLAIGDSVRTDLTGAHGFGIKCLFVMRGIHAGEFEGIDLLDKASVKELFGHPPLALTRELRW